MRETRWPAASTWRVRHSPLTAFPAVVTSSKPPVGVGPGDGLGDGPSGRRHWLSCLREWSIEATKSFIAFCISAQRLASALHKSTDSVGSAVRLNKNGPSLFFILPYPC